MRVRDDAGVASVDGGYDDGQIDIADCRGVAAMRETAQSVSRNKTVGEDCPVGVGGFQCDGPRLGGCVVPNGGGADGVTFFRESFLARDLPRLPAA